MKGFKFDPGDKETLHRVRQMLVFDVIDAQRLPRILDQARLRR